MDQDQVISWLPVILLMGLGVPIQLVAPPSGLLLVLIWPAWLAIFIAMLVRRYKKRLPFPAFGQVVEYEERPDFYRSLFVVLFLMGLFEVFVLFIMHFSRILKAAGY